MKQAGQVFRNSDVHSDWGKSRSSGRGWARWLRWLLYLMLIAGASQMVPGEGFKGATAGAQSDDFSPASQQANIGPIPDQASGFYRPVQAQTSAVYRLAFSRWDGGAHNLYIADTTGQNEQLLFTRAAGPSWSPDNERLFFFGEQGVDQQMREETVACSFATVSNGLVAVDVPSPVRDICDVQSGPWVCQRDPAASTFEPNAVCLANGIALYQNLTWKEGTARWARVSPDGSAVAYDGRPGSDKYRILFKDLSGGEQQSRYEIPGEQAAWSPDGQRLVYRATRFGQTGLWISNADDTGHVQLTGNETDAFPAWSPDGRTVAFSRRLDGNLDIYAIDVDGTNYRRLTYALGEDTLPTYTPGGEIIFRSTRNGRWDIWKMAGSGAGQTEIISNAPVGPDWSFSRMDVGPAPLFTPQVTPTPTPRPVSIQPSPLPPTVTPAPTAAAAPRAAAAPPSLLERVTVASDGAQAVGGGLDGEPPWHTAPAISADGRYVAYASWAANLVRNDINAWKDVFVHDRRTSETNRFSLSSDGVQANKSSDWPAMSDDGQTVAFGSEATNLTGNDTNNSCDRNGYPGDGPAGTLLNCTDVFVRNLQTGPTERLSLVPDGAQANGASGWPALSADGRYVAFWSKADNLVAGDTNGTDDVFVVDRQTGRIERVSVTSDGGQGSGLAQRSFVPWAGPPAISADGRYVAFWYDADDLVSGDSNGKDDVFVHDRRTGRTNRVSIASDGMQADGPSGWPAISLDGRFVVFASAAANLAPNDDNQAWDIFIHDQETGRTVLVSAADDGSMAGNGNSASPDMSADGRYVVYASEAGNLVSGDANDDWDIFIHDRQNGETSRLSIALPGLEANGGSFAPVIAASKPVVAFWSQASNLVAQDTNGQADVFVYDPERSQLLAAEETRLAAPEPAGDAKIAFLSSRDYPRSPALTYDLYLMNPDGSRQTRVTTVGLAGACFLSWLPGGDRLFYESCDGARMTIDPTSGAVSSWSLPGATGSSVSPRLSPDGRQIAYVEREGTRSNIMRVNSGGTDPQQLTSAPPNVLYDNPAWSPGGGRLAYSVQDSSSDRGLWVMNGDGSGKIRLADLFAGQSAWSPDSRKIAFECAITGATPAGAQDLCLINSDGTDLINLTGFLTVQIAGQPTWSPDGTRIGFHINVGDSYAPGHVFTVGADGADLTQMTIEGSNCCPAWSR